MFRGHWGEVGHEKRVQKPGGQRGRGLLGGGWEWVVRRGERGR